MKSNFRHYIEEHRDVVVRFGRFPHRNKVGRRKLDPSLKSTTQFHQNFDC